MSSQDILANETSGLFKFGVTASVLMLFILNQPKNANGTRKSIQTQPAFGSHVSDPAAIRLKIVPLALERIIGSPLKAPSIGKVITRGIRICIVVTPKFPNPAFMPRA